MAGFGIYQAMQPSAPDILTAVAKRQDLSQLVEAVGSITSERDLQLQFASSGIVSSVLVKEGDRVARGQTLATIRNGELRAAVAAQVANLEYAQAQLQVLEEGTRAEDVAVAEADLASKRTSLTAARSTLVTAENNLQASRLKLDALRAQAEVTLSGQVSLGRSTVTQQLVVAESALGVFDDMMDDINLADALIRSEPSDISLMRNRRLKASETIASARSAVALAGDYRTAETAFATARTAITETYDVVSDLFRIISALPEVAAYGPSQRESDKVKLSTQRTNMQAALSSLEAQLKSVQDASASFDTQIRAEETAIVSVEGTRDRAKSDITNYESAVAIAEAQLLSRKAPTREADLNAARARVRQAQAEVARASAYVSNTVLTAPTEGVVTKVNVKVGESTPIGAAVVLLGDSPLRVEMYVSEIDVPKVALSQTGSIALDAFPGVNFKLRVAEIDPGVTDRDGVPKYLVKLDFVYPHPEIKIGMTGDAQIVTDQRVGVVSIPRRAVLERPTGERYVRLYKGEQEGLLLTEERNVKLGIDGIDGDIEVLEGVSEGDTILVLEKK
jgi:HlyD family secretion protein